MKSKVGVIFFLLGTTIYRSAFCNNHRDAENLVTCRVAWSTNRELRNFVTTTVGGRAFVVFPETVFFKPPSKKKQKNLPDKLSNFFFPPPAGFRARLLGKTNRSHRKIVLANVPYDRVTPCSEWRRCLFFCFTPTRVVRYALSTVRFSQANNNNGVGEKRTSRGSRHVFYPFFLFSVRARNAGATGSRSVPRRRRRNRSPRSSLLYAPRTELRRTRVSK